MKRMEALRSKVESYMQKAAKNQSNYYNKHRKLNVNYLEKGDLVYYPNKTLSSAEKRYSAKLAPKYKGPVIVLEKLSPMVVIIGDQSGKKIGKYCIDDLKIARRSLRIKNKKNL